MRNSETLEKLHRRHNMHTLSGNWRGRYECHVANAGDWLVIWSSNDSVAFFERTGSHDELFRETDAERIVSVGFVHSIPLKPMPMSLSPSV